MSKAPLPPAPSKAKLAIATVAALAFAAVVLVTVVLPAEYGIDPLGTGEALGLAGLSGGGTQGAAPAIPVRSDGLIDQSRQYRLDRRTFELAPGEYVEFKYRLEAGQAMVYSWTASYWVRSEMHSERDGAPPGTAEFFEVVERGLQRHGSYVAPFPGIHGWYWLNENERPVTVTLDAAGFFEVAAEFRENAPAVAHDVLTTPDDLADLPVGDAGSDG